MTIQRISVGGFQVARSFYQFVNQDIMPGTGIDPKHFWQSFEEITNELAPLNVKLLDKRTQ